MPELRQVEFVAELAKLDITMPLWVSPIDIGVILDADNRDILTVDPNHQRDDDQCQVIAARIVEAVNAYGGYPSPTSAKGSQAHPAFVSSPTGGEAKAHAAPLAPASPLVGEDSKPDRAEGDGLGALGEGFSSTPHHFQANDRVQDGQGLTGSITDLDGDEVEVTWDISGMPAGASARRNGPTSWRSPQSMNWCPKARLPPQPGNITKTFSANAETW